MKQGFWWSILLGGALLIPNTTRATSNRPGLTLTGAAAVDFFGSSVGTAGDVNGDGYADVIVGAPNNDALGSNAGRAYVYFGGLNVDAVAELTLNGESVDDIFGSSVATAGDVNGDGYADVIVGAPGNDAGGSNAGRAYVYFGSGSGADAIADRVLTGAAAGSQFGYSVGTAGDVNGDGYADVIVGAPFNLQGRAYVYFGGPNMDNTADVILTGEATGNSFGISVGVAGDMNGDGYADLIVGATGYGGGNGRVYVYYGGAPPNAIPDMTLTGPGLQCGTTQLTSWFGASVGAAGDVNGDGFADVIVGAHQFSVNSSTCTLEGRAYVYHGGPGADAVADLTVTGSEPLDHLGSSVGTLGDVNQDGYSEFFAGAPHFGGQGAGRVNVYYGGPSADSMADVVLRGEVALDHFGYSVASAGDVEGDGYPDLIVGAYGNDAAGSDAGRAYVMAFYDFKLLSPNGGEQWVPGESAFVRWLGHDVADLSISFDGGVTYTTMARSVGGEEENTVSIIVPSTATEFALVRVSYTGQDPAIRTNSDESDRVFRIIIPTRVPAAAVRRTLTPTGEVAGDSFGYAVSQAGDVNGDGYADFLVGANRFVGGGSTGRVYVYFGGPGADAVADLTLTGEPVSLFGTSVRGAGDVNGDGYGDILVGAPGYSSLTGRAYLYYGGPGADAVADLTFTGQEAGSRFGETVSSGDVNGDGYQDLIVGAITYGGSTGRVYVYFGGPSADTLADLTLTGELPSIVFGRSVSSGDLNGDAHADIVVGASNYGNFTGRAYVFFGGVNPDALADLILTGDAQSSFGVSCSVGDVNGDGHADVLIGAKGVNRAYIFYGGLGIDTISDRTLTGEVSSFFGFSVSHAGDVNGDGYGDIVVGAFGYGESRGRAYVYYGGPAADTIVDHTFTGEAVADAFGLSVSAAGDVNADGHGDVIVGADGSDASGTNAGRAYLYDLNRYFVTSPGGGDTWNVGALRTITWLGAEPAELSISVDGGTSYSPLTPSAVGGGEGQNAFPVRVPHSPTKFARIRITPADQTVGGFGQSDSLFTIQTSVSLLSMLATPLPDGGVSVSWSTNPGPEDLAGYRLEASPSGRSDWQVIVALTRDTSVTDHSGGQGTHYRLFAVNGFGEELLLGEAFSSPLAPLAAWPLPYRGGALTISFATAGGLGGGSGRVEVTVHDVSGRVVRRVDAAVYPAGHRLVTWDGRDDHGRDVASGIYFLRTKGDLGYERRMKVSVLR